MKTIVPLLGWALFLCSACHVAMDYGTGWELGRYYMPRTIVPHAKSNAPRQPGVAESGNMSAPETGEEEFMLVLLGLSGLALVGVGVAVRRYVRAWHEFQKVYDEHLRELQSRRASG